MRVGMLGVVAAMLVGCQAGAPAPERDEHAGGPTPDAPPAGVVEAQRAGDTLVGPFTHGNLTVYLVRNAAAKDGREFITLDEGLKSGQVRITERGGAQGRDEAEVNELEITNASSCWLYVEAGEVVKGGKQDRTLGRDLLVAPGTTNQPLEAFCVEQGRWTAHGDTSAGALAFGSAGACVAPAAKVAILRDKNQQGVWDEVAKQRAANGTEDSSSGTFMDVVNSSDVQSRIDPYVSALAGLAADHGDAIGAVFCIEGQVVAADLYGAPGLFRHLYPKLLAAHAREAALDAVAGGPIAAAPPIAAAIAFLDQAAQGDSATEAQGATMEMERCENGQTIAFESRADGKRMHYTALRK